MVAAPTYAPEAWRELPAYTRLLVLTQADTDQDRKQVIASHLAALAPYAGTGADGPAAALISQHYQADDDRRAGRQPAPPEPPASPQPVITASGITDAALDQARQADAGKRAAGQVREEASTP